MPGVDPAVLGEWADTGQSKAVLAALTAASKSGNDHAFSAAVLSVLRAAASASSKLAPEDVAAFFADDGVRTLDAKLTLRLCDALHILHTTAEVESSSSSSSSDGSSTNNSGTHMEALSGLSALATALEAAGAASNSLLRERLPPALLAEAGLAPPEYEKSIVRTRTRLFYKQQKFNLMHEEAEGWAKLAEEVNMDHAARNTKPDELLQSVHALVGHFELDPNRVLDIVLDAIEARPVSSADVLLPLLRALGTGRAPSVLAGLVGVRFQRCAQSGEEAPAESLLSLAAELLRAKVIALPDLYPHLSPADEHMKEEASAALARVAKSAGRVAISLTQTAAEAAAAAAEAKSKAVFKIKRNQKLGLAAALLNLADFTGAHAILRRLPPGYAAQHPNLRSRLLKLIHAVVEPVYRSKVASSPARPHGSGGDGTVADYTAALPSLSVCTEFVHLPARLFPLLHVLGSQLSTDQLVFHKVLRVCRACLKTSFELDQSPLALQGDIEALLDAVLLPALSAVPHNPALSEAVWGVVKYLPYQTRYSLYGAWKDVSHTREERLATARAVTLKESKRVLQRLTKENVKMYGRKIGKLSHNCPGPLFDDILARIQVYDNLIRPVVDSLKYLTSLAFDVLSFCLVAALSDPKRQRLKSEDTNISLWLRNLALFTGAAFKKSPLHLEGVLQFVINKLKTDESYYLLILKELIVNMSGMENVEDITAEQMSALSGGPTLRYEAGSFQGTAAKGNAKELRKATQRLRDTLVARGLAAPMVVLMARMRDTIVYSAGDQHLKLTALLCDQCQETMVQFVRFLQRHVKPGEYDALVPSIQTLCQEYHLAADAAYFLLRPRRRRRIAAIQSGAESKGLAAYLGAADSVATEAMAATRVLYPEETWVHLTQRLYVTFWSLSLYDLATPTEAYASVSTKVKEAVAENDRNHAISASRRKKESARLQTLLQSLESERKEQEGNQRNVAAWLKRSKDTWIAETDRKTEMITQFLQICIVPRCMFSALDAIFCAKFVLTMHRFRTENWSMLLYLDRVLKNIVVPISSCTDNEARRYGRFLAETFSIVGHWHSDRSVFDAECARTPGFKTQLRRSDSSGKSGGASADASFVSYDDFRDAAYVWHRRVTKSFAFLLDSGEYVMVRNALLILSQLMPHFPRLSRMGTVLQQRVEAVRDKAKEDKMGDILTMGQTYLGRLKNHRDMMVAEADFHVVSKNRASAAATAATAKSGDGASKETAGGNSLSSSSGSGGPGTTTNGRAKKVSVSQAKAGGDATSVKGATKEETTKGKGKNRDRGDDKGKGAIPASTSPSPSLSSSSSSSGKPQPRKRGRSPENGEHGGKRGRDADSKYSGGSGANIRGGGGGGSSGGASGKDSAKRSDSFSSMNSDRRDRDSDRDRDRGRGHDYDRRGSGRDHDRGGDRGGNLSINDRQSNRDGGPRRGRGADGGGGAGRGNGRDSFKGGNSGSFRDRRDGPRDRDRDRDRRRR